jgi:CheY-like chemotaxis protein
MLAIGTVEITESARQGTSLAPGRFATLAVRDTGAGMTPEVRRRIFEPFFTTKEVGKGTGLGLSMAHGVVTQSGGEITVATAPGQGTTFTMFLPATAAGEARLPVAAPAVARGHETVLVVDDDRDIRAMLVRALKSAGYTVLDAASGADALRRLAEVDGAVELLLTDVKMPGMGGRELADAARARYPSLRVLFSSGYAENAIADHGVLAGGIHFIAKPYTLQALTARIRDVLAA